MSKGIKKRKIQEDRKTTQVEGIREYTSEILSVFGRECFSNFPCQGYRLSTRDKGSGTHDTRMIHEVETNDAEKRGTCEYLMTLRQINDAEMNIHTRMT